MKYHSHSSKIHQAGVYHMSKICKRLINYHTYTYIKLNKLKAGFTLLSWLTVEKNHDSAYNLCSFTKQSNTTTFFASDWSGQIRAWEDKILFKIQSQDIITQLKANFGCTSYNYLKSWYASLIYLSMIIKQSDWPYFLATSLTYQI